jgi:hypothetical protein
MCAKAGTDCRRYLVFSMSLGTELRKALTGGLTNQAVSHSRSFRVVMMELCTSDPASRTAISSSFVIRGLRIKDASVMPQSKSVGRQAGSSGGYGGGESAG